MRFPIFGGVFILLLMTTPPSFSQCDHAPADCISSTWLPDSAERLANPVTPKEVSMEIRLHDFLTDMLQQQADQHNWILYQYDESDGSGYLDADRKGPLADVYRPPHEYEIAFIIIVNKDSFQIWKDWTTNNTANYQDRIQAMMAEYQKTGNQEVFKKSSNDMQTELKNKTIMFRNSCMLRIKFQFNPWNTAISSTPDDLHWTVVSPIPHSVLTVEAHNNKVEENAIFDLNQFSRCTDFAFILFGKWNMEPRDKVYYYPQFHPNNGQMNLTTPKTIPSDQVQSIAMHVEGAPRYIRQFLQSLNTQSIAGLVYK